MALRLRLAALGLCTILVLDLTYAPVEVSSHAVHAGNLIPSTARDPEPDPAQVDTIVSALVPPPMRQGWFTESEARAVAARTVWAEPRRVIGADDRQLVTDTRFWPNSAIVQVIAYDANNQPWLCTGFFYAPNAVATAGHCLYNHDPNKGSLGWRQSAAVTPGLNGNTAPFPSCATRVLYSVKSWTEQGNTNADYGAIRLDCNLGYRTGILSIEEARSQDVMDYSTKYLIGYSGDKGGATQWLRSGIITGWNVFRIKYNIDTVGGDSGAPVYRVGGDCPTICVLGINSWEYAYDDNYGVRIRAEMLRFFWNLARRTYIPIADGS